MDIAHARRTVRRLSQFIIAFTAALEICAPTSQAAEQALRFTFPPPAALQPKAPV